ncbi:MAG: CBS domain-containing protein [Candidatus Nanopelagicaceae bacterium]|jgi:CBS domain-containing protein|nr:CBS domain-containing protein [Candidatus Nanopelagicaceae bacterium]
MRTEELTRVFLAKLAGTPVFDPNADRVGKIRDAVASLRQDNLAPRILGFIVEVPQRRKIFIPITRVTSIDDGGVFITGSLNIRRYQPKQGEIALLGELLDNKTRSRENGNVVVIEDIGMELRDNRDWYAEYVHVQEKSKSFGRRSTQTLSWSSVEIQIPSHIPDLNSPIEDITLLPAQDIAAALRELEVNRQREIAHTLGDEKLADVLEEMDDADRLALVSLLEGELVADVLSEMNPDDAADVLKEVGSEKAESLLNLMEDDEAQDVRRLMAYEDFSAGGMMTTDPVILSGDATVAQALAVLRQKDVSAASAAQVFVCRAPLETPTGRLVGVVHMQRLLREPPALSLAIVAEKETNAISADTPLNEVVRHLANYNLLAAPVVDEHDRLLGAVTVDDVLDHLLPTNWRRSGAGK